MPLESCQVEPARTVKRPMVLDSQVNGVLFKNPVAFSMEQDYLCFLG